MAEILSKEDVFLMMKSYENNVKYNTQLYDRQEILVKEQSKIIDNLKTITDTQEKVNNQLEILVNTLTSHNALCNISVSDISKSITEGYINNVREHSKLKYHMVGISGGLLVVIIALITAFEKLWSKSDIIDAVAKYIGVS
jgi:hypothetical protein